MFEQKYPIYFLYFYQMINMVFNGCIEFIYPLFKFLVKGLKIAIQYNDLL